MKIKFYYCQNFHIRNYLGIPDPSDQSKTIPFSQQFCEYFAENFERMFVDITGIRPSNKVTITRANPYYHKEIYEAGDISKLNPTLWILPISYFDISFCWKSKTGNMVQPWDEKFDELDLECWLENIQTAEYWKLISTEKVQHPFQIKGLPFELKVFDFGVDTVLRIFIQDGSSYEQLEDMISQSISRYNNKSETMQRAIGVVHNYSFSIEGNCLTVLVDTGSAGIEGIKTVLKALKKETSILKVEIDI